MEQIIKHGDYCQIVKEIKAAILRSRYNAAKMVNKEMLALYYNIGGYISYKDREDYWGKNALSTISEQLQKELPGLRGFSVTSLKKMRAFYEGWCSVFSNRPSLTDDLSISLNNMLSNRPLTTDDLTESDLSMFLSVSFTNHYELLLKTNSLEQRLYYIRKCDLSALDEYVKLPNENHSIGIILCKSQSRKTVEFAFRDTSKPMGVATYKTASELPNEYKGILPEVSELEKLL
jgi:hypothetical protein